MALTGAFVRAALLEQTERTRHCSKADIEQFIEESELKILALESQINALMELRDSQRACVLALKHIVSPIRTLPVELLVEIFELAIEDRTHIDDVHRISQVCSDWRQAAHGTPRLWTRTLRVKLCKGDEVDGLKAWLARSAPLPIRISFPPESGDIDVNILVEVLRVATRWRSLKLGCTLPRWLVRQLSKCRLNSLEDLDLEIIHDNETNSIPISFTTVPRLRKLIINLIDFPAAPQPLVPWVQLTDLTISNRDHDVIFGILAQCANLIAASVTTGGRQLPQVRRDIVILSQLHTLSLLFECRYSVARHITPFFDNLSTPVLRSLCVKFDDRAQWTQAHFTAFQLRAQCNITQLEFARTNWYIARDPLLTSDDLGAIIRYAPSLTHLKLTGCGNAFDDAFIRTLYANYKDGVAPLVPHLHNLVLGSRSRTFSDDILAGMIASRWWTDTQLVPPTVARWTHVKLDIGRNYWSTQFVDILKDIPSDVLVLS
ncbi:hypothetical protein MSAN_01342100 [Mycena sanguinolenta]|uniref:F-box domain-containing protein n=1 Tax=Mycena sanguinolenta TaxID=230812 RepID=A0A8H7D0X8_9AGAR|nr:hypothetical protein MSAN_01342100 [Mycena sanguinolenta]